LIESEVLVFLGAISASFFVDCLGVEKVRCSGPGMRKIACWREKSRGRILQVAQAPKREGAKTLVFSCGKQTPITVQAPSKPFWLLLACDGHHHMQSTNNMSMSVCCCCVVLDRERLDPAVE
jgi:hypothetical protein